MSVGDEFAESQQIQRTERWTQNPPKADDNKRVIQVSLHSLCVIHDHQKDENNNQKDKDQSQNQRPQTNNFRSSGSPE